MTAHLVCPRARGLIRQGLASLATKLVKVLQWCAVASQTAAIFHISFFFFFPPSSLLRKHLLCPKPAPELKIKIKDFCLFIKHFSKRDYYIHIIFPCFVQTRLSQH